MKLIAAISSRSPIYFIAGDDIDSLPTLLLSLVDGTFGIFLVSPRRVLEIDDQLWLVVSKALILTGARDFWYSGATATRLEAGTDMACVALNKRWAEGDRSIPHDIGIGSRSVITASDTEKNLLNMLGNEEADPLHGRLKARVLLAFIEPDAERAYAKVRKLNKV